MEIEVSVQKWLPLVFCLERKQSYYAPIVVRNVC